jgi:multicomponent K+:H+ antiporter subunit D
MTDVLGHLIILPIVLPLAAAGLMLFARNLPAVQAGLGVASVASLLITALVLMAGANTGVISPYLVGNWQAPFGIVLVLDRFAALMLLLVAILALTSLVYALSGPALANRGSHFHPLFQVQLMGLNGAFLTGDLFNLFVFFEVLLIASYGLLMHGGGAVRLKSAIHFVVFNLTGSALFLIAVSLLYGVTGTLNMADLAVKLVQVAPESRGLAYAACALLLVVFCIKAAIVPLGFWLPDSYTAASAPVAALFVIMTKVGLYAIARVHTLLLSGDGLAATGITWFALATLMLAGFGVLASRSVRSLAAYSVLGSAGFLLVGIGQGTAPALTAALFYLVFTTFAAAALYLVGDLVGAGRGPDGDALLPGGRLHRPALLAVLFFVTAIAVVGLPPLGGFVGKAMLLGASQGDMRGWIWAGVLIASLMSMVGFARAYSTLFWKSGEPSVTPPAAPPSAAPAATLLALSISATVWAAPVERYMQATARALIDRGDYIQASLLAAPVPAPAKPSKVTP